MAGELDPLKHNATKTQPNLGCSIPGVAEICWAQVSGILDTASFLRRNSMSASGTARVKGCSDMVKKSDAERVPMNAQA